ncbi:hybrid sensor histidine kinase/response regulator [Maridesulfovibrio hydrothermalis]|uniref:histidine kinase n=1 Tax=Maridesulfovibrio hydrothermalis AM13 = DSM 14728 TaxID=1121451 RepID=L0RD39_9BACT|nr:hybrid sensor histidine kinase/response regulator [Maridesulfovibrio hydrothermalis]CCO24115.1 Cache sensor hybrid histidine kinase [Maridesulfovibrio hydrothermalis AM13 = DSM 14728]
MNFLKKWWLAVCFISLTIIFAAVIIIPPSLTSRDALTGLARDIMVNISSYTLDKSENYLRPAEKAAELTRFLADSNIVSSENPKSMIGYFYQQLSLYQQFTSVYYGNIKGEFFMASRSDSKVQNGFYTKIIQINGGNRTVSLSWDTAQHKKLAGKMDLEDKYDPRQRPWFIDAVMNNDVVWTAPYLFFTEKKPGITTASPVYDHKGVLQGVVGVDISIEGLSNFLRKLTIGENGKAFIVNSSGDVVAFPDLDELKQASQDRKKIRLSKISELKDSISRLAFESLNLPPDKLPEEPVFTTFMHDGDRYSAMFTPFKDSHWPWLIGIYIPENDYLGGIKHTRDINILISLIIIVLAGFSGWAIARKLDGTKEKAIAANMAKNQFLAVMSHEIRTPMNVILGAADLLKNAGPREDQKDFIKLLENAGDGLLDLINDILDISKIEAGLLDLESVSFNPCMVLKQTFKVFAIAADKKGIQFEMQVADNFPARVTGDPVRLKQVLINLLDNAVKFTSNGGVYVHARSIVSGRNNMITLEFSVRDTGIGVPEEQHKSIFESFTQAGKPAPRKNQGKGTGLGLAISKSLSIMMGGDITIKSSPDNGSTFIFTAAFPSDMSTPVSGKRGGCDASETITPKKILLVEDNKSNMLLFAYFLEGSMHSMENASNGKEGVKAFIEMKPDIVFMDIEMPVMNGYEATRKIREWEAKNSTSQVPIIALSANTMKGTEAAVYEAGCTGYMTKPVTKLQLLERIERDEE